LSQSSGADAVEEIFGVRDLCFDFLWSHTLGIGADEWRHDADFFALLSTSAKALQWPPWQKTLDAVGTSHDQTMVLCRLEELSKVAGLCALRYLLNEDGACVWDTVLGRMVSVSVDGVAELVNVLGDAKVQRIVLPVTVEDVLEVQAGTVEGQLLKRIGVWLAKGYAC
jgi:hypothetical protein